ncbi:MAG: hypothetical protein EZS28_028658, partial [Streblomastix strix]
MSKKGGGKKGGGKEQGDSKKSGGFSQAIESGKSFSDAAKEFSEDKARQGGDLGWFGKGQMDPAFESTAFATQVGQRSEPFKTQHGWHILLVEGKK